MSIDSKFLNLFIKVTENAAIGASKFIGKKDKIAADKGAVDPMRRELNKINMEGTVVIGEGEMDKAPMLYIGEKLGTLNGPKFDIAVDPLEGTKFTANGEPNAFSVLAISEKGSLLSAPDTYMEKIVIGSNSGDVSVQGAVLNEGLFVWEKGKRVRNYINNSGGRYGKTQSIVVELPNGFTKRKNWFNNPKVLPNSKIYHLLIKIQMFYKI